MTTARNSIKKVAAGRRPKAARQDMGTRMAILKAARAVFARRGFEGASTREVAEAAGVNNAMIYYHFKDKQDLYRSVLADSFAAFDRVWEHRIFRSDASVRAKIQIYRGINSLQSWERRAAAHHVDGVRCLLGQL
jgi:AcrR family transcriptional regulator